MNGYLRLGVNIDHVATIRNARGGVHPDPVAAAKVAVEAGADGITAHLREDRRHISDADITRLCNEIDKPLNLEMAATDEMLEIALSHVPHAACIVPEKRQERTTEGGLDARGGHNRLVPFVDTLSKAGIRVSLFIEPDLEQLDAARSGNLSDQWEKNLDLSTDRAKNVEKFLIKIFKEHGSPPVIKLGDEKDKRFIAKFVAKGYGEFQPVESNETPETRASNRRVDIIIKRD